DHAVPIDRAEVVGQGEIHSGARGPVGRARDRPTPQLGKPDDARILKPPLLALDPFDWSKERFWIDRPAVDAVRRARDGQVRNAAQVLDAREEHRLAAGGGRRWVEYGIHRIRPVGRGEDWIARVPFEQFAVAHAAAA